MHKPYIRRTHLYALLLLVVGIALGIGPAIANTKAGKDTPALDFLAELKNSSLTEEAEAGVKADPVAVQVALLQTFSVEHKATVTEEGKVAYEKEKAKENELVSKDAVASHIADNTAANIEGVNTSASIAEMAVTPEVNTHTGVNMQPQIISNNVVNSNFNSVVKSVDLGPQINVHGNIVAGATTYSDIKMNYFVPIEQRMAQLVSPN